MIRFTEQHPPKQESDYDRYEKYIEEISWNYVEATGDDWGGFESREIARRLHPFDEWLRNHPR